MATKLVAPVNIDYGTVGTVLGAERKIRGLAVDLRWYGPTHPSAGEWADGIQLLAQAVEATTGEKPADLLARLDDAIDRSYAYQLRESEKAARRLGHRDTSPARNF